MSILANKDTRVVIQGGQAGVNAARRMADLSRRIDDQQLRVARPLHRPVGGDHVTISGIWTATASASSRAAVSGRLSVDGSASGTAIA